MPFGQFGVGSQSSIMDPGVFAFEFANLCSPMHQLVLSRSLTEKKVPNYYFLCIM